MTSRLSPEELTRLTMPSKYPRIARQVSIAMAIDAKPCTGRECDEGRPCARHRNAGRVGARYGRLVALWRTL
jgi:hypothetical protein